MKKISLLLWAIHLFLTTELQKILCGYILYKFLWTNLLSLVYISALLEFCKDRKDAKDSFLINGTSAPLILDSPFATLDDSYDKICAKFIPKMTDQVILILNKKSYESVSHEIKDKVGSVYFSTMLSSKKTDSKDEMMKLFDKEVPLTKYNQEYRYTEINRIELWLRWEVFGQTRCTGS